MTSIVNNKESRFAKVQRILDEAAGKSSADYGGLGRFWGRSHAEFLKTVVHGIPMIAPVEEKSKSCCGTSTSDGGKTRADRSGLIQGLRGETPFDGMTFPRLPWGGNPLSDDDIGFIADWINDGCPAKDRESAVFPLEEQKLEFKLVDAQKFRLANFEATPRAAVEVAPAEPAPAPSGKGLKQRLNLDCLSETQLEQLRFAFRELYELNKWPQDRRSYNNQALIHQNHCQHGWEKFLPWHRVYLYEFEQAMQDVCPGITMPYWDWTMAQYVPEDPTNGWILPKSFKAFLTGKSIHDLRQTIPSFSVEECKTLLKIKDVHYTTLSAFFDAVEEHLSKKFTVGDYRKRLIDALLESNSLWYPLRYPAQYPNNQTINQANHYHYPGVRDMEEIQSLRTFRDYGGGDSYNDSFGFLDQNPHNTLHIWTGGMNPTPAKAGPVPENRNRGVQISGRRFHSREDMYSQPTYGDMFSNLTASYDPVFWPLHANIDRLWWEWQQANPSSLPVDLDGILTPWSYTIRDTLDIHQFGYEYVKGNFNFPAQIDEPISRFVSKPVTLPATLLKFREAEVRLHQVPQLVRSCFIRVFLNLPDANYQTPLNHPNYAGYASVFGHGPCYGGPGHCDLPPSQSRPYDRRERNHNTPRNMRINVSTALRRIMDSGGRDIQITLVVIGADYREEKDLLRMDRLSLTFLD